MSVIAFDGKIFAVDSQATTADLITLAQKYMVVGDHTVLAWTGSQEGGLELAHWYIGGCEFSKWPDTQKDKDTWTRLVVFTKEGVKTYESRPFMQKNLRSFEAYGSGRDFALGAMHMGANAIKAVEVTCYHSAVCCGPIVAFRFKDDMLERVQ